MKNQFHCCNNVSSKTEGGLTPLNLAQINKSKNIVDILLNNKYIYKNGNLNITNELGFTPLHLSIIINSDNACPPQAMSSPPIYKNIVLTFMFGKFL